MGSSEVQKLVDDKNRLKHKLKLARQNNQRLKKANVEAIGNLKSKIKGVPGNFGQNMPSFSEI